MEDKKREVILEAVQSAWQSQFTQEVTDLYPVFWMCWKSVYHIGSTAIPGMLAKPTLDIMLVVHDINKVDTLKDAVFDLGYIAKGEYGIPGRRYYHQGNLVHLSHLHVFEENSSHIQRHLLFRDYMRSHESEKKLYSGLKQELAKKFRYDPEGYSDAKGVYIQRIDQLALTWKEQTGWIVPAADWTPSDFL